MPMMSPLNWVTLMMMFIMMLVILNITNFFFFLSPFKTNYKLSNKMHLNWKW